MVQNILNKASGIFKSVFRRFVSFGRKFGWVKVSIAALLLIIGGWAVAGFLGGGPRENIALNQTRAVELRSVSELSSDTAPLAVAGTVNSKSEAEVRAEAGGRITAVNYALGDYVPAGAVIASTENASGRAAVLQAQGALDAAKAGASVTATTLAGAKESSVAALLSAYGAVEKTIHADIDPMFAEPNGIRPQFLVQSSNSQEKINAENTRSSLAPLLERHKKQAASINTQTNLAAELEATQQELRTIRDFLDSIIRTLNNGIATNGITTSDIATYLATANTARTSIVTSLSSLITSAQSLETAQKNAEGSGSTSSAAQASLTQAEANLAAARANLEKTIVRAPISGSINSISLNVGDFLAAGSVAVVIANNNALEVVAYVTDQDARELVVGAKATITTGGKVASGTVTRIAPALDPTTKKIEVRVGVVGGVDNLINGQAVTVSIERANKVSTTEASRIVIPISALKIRSENMVVFTVSENNTLVPHPVEIGALLGDRVEILSGLTGDMRIVTDARGLQPDEKVEVK